MTSRFTYMKKPRINIYGTRAEAEWAEDALDIMGKGVWENLNEGEARIQIQDLIRLKHIKASILYDGNGVWDFDRIIRNLKKIVKAGTLYDSEKPRYISIGSMLRVPSAGKTILNKYFYNFLHLDCGSIAHYNIQGWVTHYPTVADLKQFFIKNEYGNRVKDHISHWHTDAKRIVEEIEKLLGITDQDCVREDGKPLIELSLKNQKISYVIDIDSWIEKARRAGNG